MKWEQDLDKDIRTNNTKFDNAEFDENYPHPYSYNIHQPEFTECNRNALLEQFLKIKTSCRAILEIGVCRNRKDSSTYVFLENKEISTIYVGIDLDDKSFLNSKENNIYTLKKNSSDIDENIEKFNQLGISEFDFIFIDGWHSINQVLTDWEYTKMLSQNGIVGFHDTSCHLGPHLFVRALDKNQWNVVINDCEKDWGISFAWQK